MLFFSPEAMLTPILVIIMIYHQAGLHSASFIFGRVAFSVFILTLTKRGRFQAQFSGDKPVGREFRYET